MRHRPDISSMQTVLSVGNEFSWSWKCIKKIASSVEAPDMTLFPCNDIARATFVKLYYLVQKYTRARADRYDDMNVLYLRKESRLIK